MDRHGVESARVRRLAEDPGVVGGDAAGGIANGLVALDGDLAGDGFDDAEDGGVQLVVGLCVAEVFGADLVEEAPAMGTGRKTRPTRRDR